MSVVLGLAVVYGPTAVTKLLAELYSNGYLGTYNIVFRLLDVRFGHLFRTLAGRSKL